MEMRGADRFPHGDDAGAPAITADVVATRSGGSRGASVTGRTALERAFAATYRSLGVRYPTWLPLALLPLAVVVASGGVLAMRAYVDMTLEQLAVLAGLAVALFAIEAAAVIVLVNRQVEPVQRWLRAGRDAADAEEAFAAALALPLRVLRHRLPLGLAVPLQLAFGVAAIVVLDWPWPTLAILLPGGLLVTVYWLVLSFLALELAARPVLHELSASHSSTLPAGLRRLPLRWRLLLTLPAVNVITGAVAGGVGDIGTDNDDGDVADLAIGLGAAVAVSLTVSVVLTVLLAASVAEPLAQLLAATERIAAGDHSRPVPVTSTDETGELAAAFNEMMVGLQQREALRHAFGVFVGPQLIDRVLVEGTDLTGTEVDLSAVFVDVRGFTEFAEAADAGEVVAWLNELYGAVVPIVERHGGHANQFVGDGLLALFGAPAAEDGHAARAVGAALEIAALDASAAPLGIGVNSGPAVVGTIGGGGRREFTAIGDTINTAARVEGATRQTGDRLLITHATLDRLDPPTQAGWVERPHVPLKGKRGAVRLFAPADPAPARRRALDASRSGAGDLQSTLAADTSRSESGDAPSASERNS